MRYMSGMGWTVETVSGVDAEIAGLPVKLRARDRQGTDEAGDAMTKPARRRAAR